MMPLSKHWPWLSRPGRSWRRPVPHEGWDLFGLDVTGAAEVLRIAVAYPPPIHARLGDADLTRQAVLRLVEALAEHLAAPGPGADQTLVSQLEREAAAVQLRRALAVVT